MIKVKIYGERNSGAIYLEWLIKKNLEVDLTDDFEYGWKHRLAPSEEELTEYMKKDVIYLCLVKNPYSWLLSLHKRPYNHESLRKTSFAEFLRYSFGDYMNPTVMWNIKNRSYLNMRDYVRNHKIIRYEDLLKDPKGSIEELADRFGLDKPGFFKNIHNLLTHSHGVNRRKFHTDYYLKERWRSSLNNDHIRQINKYLDDSLMKELEYIKL